MASYISRVSEFCREKETFSAYVERMEMFFYGNNIVETPGSEHVAANQCVAAQKRAIFLTEVGPKVYSVSTKRQLCRILCSGSTANTIMVF